MWYFVLYVLLAILVFWDAKVRKNSYLAWSIPTVIIGPITIPFYLANRNLKEGEVREGGTAWNVLKNFALLWTITMFIAGISGLISASNVADEAASEAAQAGAAIGTTIGLGMIFVLWLIIAVGALILGMFLKKNSIVEKGPTGDLSAK